MVSRKHKSVSFEFFWEHWENNDVKKLSQTENRNPLKKIKSIWEFIGKGCKRKKNLFAVLKQANSYSFLQNLGGIFFPFPKAMLPNCGLVRYINPHKKVNRAILAQSSARGEMAKGLLRQIKVI